MTGLERLAVEAVALAGGDHPCAVLDHVWVFDGGTNCGCEEGACSVPLHSCSSCGDYDYGDNDEAAETRAACAVRQ